MNYDSHISSRATQQLKSNISYLVVFGCKLVQALLNDMISIEVLDQNNDVETECDDDRVNLAIFKSV